MSAQVMFGRKWRKSLPRTWQQCLPKSCSAAMRGSKLKKIDHSFWRRLLTGLGPEICWPLYLREYGYYTLRLLNGVNHIREPGGADGGGDGGGSKISLHCLFTTRRLTGSRCPSSRVGISCVAACSGTSGRETCKTQSKSCHNEHYQLFFTSFKRQSNEIFGLQFCFSSIEPTSGPWPMG